MRVPQDCVRKLWDEIAFYERHIKELETILKDAFPRFLIHYYQGLIRVNIEVIALLEKPEK